MSDPDKRALNEALCDQKTIEQLTSSGLAAQRKREELRRRVAEIKEAEAKAEAEAEAKAKAEQSGDKGSS